MAQNEVVQRLWNYCNVLRDDGMSYGDYVEAAPALSSLSRPASLESPGRAFRGASARRDEHSPDVRLSPPRPCARGIRTSCSAQLMYLLFLKMADERTKAPYNQKSPVPEKYSWPSLLKKDGDELFDHYRKIGGALVL